MQIPLRGIWHTKPVNCFFFSSIKSLLHPFLGGCLDESGKKQPWSLNRKDMIKQLLAGAGEGEKEEKRLTSHGKVDFLRADFVSFDIVPRASCIQVCVNPSLVHRMENGNDDRVQHCL